MLRHKERPQIVHWRSINRFPFPLHSDTKRKNISALSSPYLTFNYLITVYTARNQMKPLSFDSLCKSLLSLHSGWSQFTVMRAADGSSYALQVCIFFINDVLFQQVVDGDDPAVVELPVQCQFLLLHLWLYLHHLQCGIVMITVLHCLELFCQVLLPRGK